MAVTLKFNLRDETPQGFAALKKRFAELDQAAKQGAEGGEVLRASLDMTALTEVQRAYNEELMRTASIVRETAQARGDSQQSQSKEPHRSIGGELSAGAVHVAVEATTKWLAWRAAIYAVQSALSAVGTVAAGVVAPVVAVAGAAYGMQSAFKAAEAAGSSSANLIRERMDAAAEGVSRSWKGAWRTVIDDIRGDLVDPIIAATREAASGADTEIARIIGGKEWERGRRMSGAGDVVKARTDAIDASHRADRADEASRAALRARNAGRIAEVGGIGDPARKFSGAAELDAEITKEKELLQLRLVASRTDAMDADQKKRIAEAEKATELELQQIRTFALTRLDRGGKMTPEIAAEIELQSKAELARLDEKKEAIRAEKEITDKQFEEAKRHIEKLSDMRERAQQEERQGRERTLQAMIDGEERALAEVTRIQAQATAERLRGIEEVERALMARDIRMEKLERSRAAGEHQARADQVTNSGVLGQMRAGLSNRDIGREYIEMEGMKGDAEKRKAMADVRRGRVSRDDWENAAGNLMLNRTGNRNDPQSAAIRQAIYGQSNQMQLQSTLDGQMADVQTALLNLQQQTAALNQQSAARGQNFKQLFQRRGGR